MALATGIALDDAGFEMLVGEQRVGPRRLIGPSDVGLLEDVAARYARAVRTGAGSDVFLTLGRELSAWLDGDARHLAILLDRAPAPCVFEVAGPRSPSAKAWAALRAPWELLARPGEGFLAEDGLIRFTVVRRLGTQVEPGELDGFRLGLAFMASSPRGQRELDFEAEEAAILAAVGETRLDLLVEDTGDPAQLGSRLAEVRGMPVVHLSCHGLNNWRDPQNPGAEPVPMLMMETDAGAERPTTAADLVDLLSSPPRLLFVSACLTATGADAAGQLPPGNGHKGDPEPSVGGTGLVAHSLATALVRAGIPAVIGWDGSVDDEAATVFAQQLYRRVAGKADLAQAVGDARRALLGSDTQRVRADWHLARLWLGPAGGGPLVSGNLKRSLVPATHGTKTFLAGKREVPVAAAQMFVGRRPELQQSLRALRSGERAGVLLHGQGRLGKSSLAARIADRCPDRAVAVVFGDYSPLGILDAVAAAVRTDQTARGLIETRMADVRQRPEAIETALVDLLTGPCAQAGDGHRPLLLIIDDVEQILRHDAAGPHRVVPEHAAALRGVLRAFDPAETDSRLLLTSRFTFTLDGLEDRLEHVQLRPLSAVAQRKLQHRQQSDVPAERLQERAALAERALAVAQGNPGLQDLIGLRLVYSQDVPLARAEAAVTGMETYLRRGGLPSDAEVRGYLEKLALDTLLDQAGPAHRALLRATTLFTLPVPATIIDTIAGDVGGSSARLRGLGLLDPYPDLYDPTQLALAANPLTAARLNPLTPVEQTALAAGCVEALFTAWGGEAPRQARAADLGLDLQLTQLALQADNPAIVTACAAGAVRALSAGHATVASSLGLDAVRALDAHHQPVPLGLLRVTAGAALTNGDGATGQALLDRAVTQTEAVTDPDADPLEKARVLAEHAQHLITRGDTSQAEQLLHQANGLFGFGDSPLEAAVTWGKIGDIVQARGDLDEALRIRREVQLPVYERLGDVRSAAVTWGQIGDIAFQRGDLDEAAALQGRRLEANRKLGDLDGIAAASWNLAQIDLAQKQYESALPRLMESFEGFRHLQRPDGIAVVGGNLGSLLLARRDTQAARQVLQESHAAAVKIGLADLAQQIAALLDQSAHGTEEE